MTEEPKTKIILQFRNKPITIEVDEKDAFNVLDNLLGRGVAVTQSHTTSSMLSSPLKSSPSDSKVKVPERSLIEQFIKSKSGYRYSIDELIERFVGDELSKQDGKESLLWLNALNAKLNRIHKVIAEAEHGKWLSAGRGFQRSFKFVKDSESEVKQGEDKQLTIESS